MAVKLNDTQRCRALYKDTHAESLKLFFISTYVYPGTAEIFIAK